MRRHGSSKQVAGSKGSQANSKKTKKEADAIVARAVAFQADLDEKVDIMTTVERIDGLNSAISLYEQALETCAGHADASYNWAVATIEKMECGCNSIPPQAVLTRCVDVLDSVIQRDTSRRAETTGLAHRAIGNAIREYSDVLLCAKGANENELLARGIQHFESCIEILAGSRDMDMYLLDYGRYLRFCLDKLLNGTSPVFAEKIRAGRDLVQRATSVLSNCLQTECHGGLDLDVLIEAADVCILFLQFMLGKIGCDWERIPDEFLFCVVNLMAYEKAISAVRDPADNTADNALKELYEVLVKYFTIVGDVRNTLKNVNDMISLCDRVSRDRNAFADRGDSLFFLGMIMINRPFVSECIASVWDTDIIDADDLTAAYAKSVSSFIQSCANVSTSSSPLLRLPPVANAALMCLYAAAVQYEASLRAASEPGAETDVLQQPVDEEDVVAVYFNLACIGWNMKDEIYCASMLHAYCEVLCCRRGSSVEDVLGKLVADVNSDPDLCGMPDSEWFRSFVLHQRRAMLANSMPLQSQPHQFT